MDKQAFLKQMIEFGQELLAQEQKPKINILAKDSLQKLCDHLHGAVNAAADLENIFNKFDLDAKRMKKASKAVSLIMKVQELVYTLAEDEDLPVELP